MGFIGAYRYRPIRKKAYRSYPGAEAVDCPATSIKLPNLLLPKKSDPVKKKTTALWNGNR